MRAYSLRPRLCVAAAVFSTAIVAACGFHLQGRATLSRTFETTHIDAEDSQSDFAQGLRQALARSGATVVDKAEGASAVIHVSTDRLDERVLSVSARNVPLEYELVYAVRLSVGAGGKEIMAPEDLTATRDFSFDERQVLAKEREKEILRAALARDLVGIVMRRLAAL
jgi:LPS-assembly lipoprotein